MLTASEINDIASELGDETKHCFIFNKDGAFSVQAFAHAIIAAIEKDGAEVGDGWPDVDEFAQQIRWLNGGNKMGSGQLAESLLGWLQSRAPGAATPDARDERAMFEAWDKRVYALSEECYWRISEVYNSGGVTSRWASWQACLAARSLPVAQGDGE